MAAGVGRPSRGGPPGGPRGRSLDNFRPALERAAARWALRTGLDGRDLVQEALLQVLRRLRTTPPQPDLDLGPLLGRVLQDVAANAARGRRRAEACLGRLGALLSASGVAGASPLDELPDAERTGLLSAAVERLPDRLRLVVMWSFFDGLTAAQIGARLDCSPRKVCGLKERALRRLYRDLAGKV